MAEEPGIRVRTHTRVDDLNALDTDEVVLAAGPWSARLAATAGLHLPLEPRKGQLVKLAGRLDVRHKVVDGSYLAAVAAVDQDLQVSTVIETTYDGHVLVGSSRERKGFDTSVDPAVTAALIDEATRLMPAVRSLRQVDAWAGLRPWLPGGLPALGRSATGLWVATGHEGAGVGLGPISGELIAAAISGERLPLDLAPFRPDRFGDAADTGPRATAPRPPAARG
jgi:glycine/D-amino acid oxidase-like deaminating enzyme